MAEETISVISVTQAAKEIGTGGNNPTQSVNVCGADLGSVFDWNGRTYIAFGDTFGCPLSATPPALRQNTLAFTTDNVLDDGITFDGWITDGSGNAKQLFAAAAGAISAISTHGLSIGSIGYLFYMQVTEHLGGGRWNCNLASVAKSTDGGQNWTKLSNLVWDEGNFNQVAIYKQGGFVYFFGIPCGRLGSVKLMRVLEASIEDKEEYEYLIDTDDGGVWEKDAEVLAVTVVDGPAGELSVAWNDFLGRYIMLYLTSNTNTTWIAMRVSQNLWGPWSGPIFVVGANDFPCLYAPFTKDSYVAEGGKIAYFRMSRFCPGFDPYSTYWMKMELEKESAPGC
jgi:hypothetical protein